MTIKSLSYLVILEGALTMGSLIVSSHLHPSHALPSEPIVQNALSQGTVIPSDISFRQPDTGEIGDPNDRPRGGGSRCGENIAPCIDEPLTVLVPFPSVISVDEQGLEMEAYQAWGQTLEANPTIWFYLPYGAEDIHAVDFEVLTAEGDRLFHTTDIVLPDTPGVWGYTLPTAQGLNIGETYRWNLLVQFDPLAPALDALVSGRIQRVSPLPTRPSQPNPTSSLEHAQFLAESGIWYDLLTTMATAYPQDQVFWQSAWQQVLTDVGLEDIAAVPLPPI